MKHYFTDASSLGANLPGAQIPSTAQDNVASVFNLDPAQNLQADNAAALNRELWLDCQLTSSFLSYANTATLGILVALLVTLLILYGHVANSWLILWGLALMLLIGHRYWAGNSLRKMDWKQQPAHFLRRFQQHTWSWPLSAGVWASSLLFYFQQVPLENKFISVVILIGMGAFAVSFMAARLDVFRRYVDYMASVSLLVFLLLASLLGHSTEKAHDIAMIVLILAFWRLLRTAGASHHARARQSFGLQFDNEKLIADLRQQSTAAFEAIQAKDRLLANAAHDLRQPIHALAFYAELLRTDPGDAPELVPKILNATGSVNSLFNSLFDFAKMESMGVQVRKQAVPVCEIINQMIVQFTPAAQAKHLQLRLRIGPAIIETDPLLIQRIVGNFLSNAIRHTKTGGVLLSSRVREGRAWIEVYDTGPGIAPEHLPYVFHEFYKVPTQGTDEGFGLGLAIVQRLADAMGHKVDVRSRLGRGSRFCVEIPVIGLQPK